MRTRMGRFVGLALLAILASLLTVNRGYFESMSLEDQKEVVNFMHTVVDQCSASNQDQTDTNSNQHSSATNEGGSE